MKHAIYYANGEIYRKDPFDAPGEGVLVIVEEDKDHGCRLISNSDYYLLDDRGDGPHWWEADLVTMLRYLIKPGHKKVLFGDLVPNDVFSRIYQKALNDDSFIPKSGYSRRHNGRVA